MFKLALQALEISVEIQIDYHAQAIVCVLNRGTILFRFDGSYDWIHIQDLLNCSPRFKNRITATSVEN